MKLKLLILSQYFPPEIGAPQNRLFELAVRLQKKGIDVSILTAMPNYPNMEVQDDYKGLKHHYEEMDNLKVYRSSIYVSKNTSIVSRLKNYFSFVWSSYKNRKKLEGNFDFILCESPPLFLGISAYLISKSKKAKLIFNVSDLWPESAEKLGIVNNKFLLKMATYLEEFFYKKSALITGQTQGIVKNIKDRFPNKNVYWLPNGVDSELFKPDNKNQKWRVENGFTQQDILFFYGGILGHAQGLEIIIEASKSFKGQKNIHFILMGAGPEKEKLMALKETYKIENFHFLDPVKKTKIGEVISSIDASIIPLKKLPLFEGAIPSKIFENLAMEKPIILGVNGEAKELFIEKGKCGLHFEPENVDDLVSCINKLIAKPELKKQFGESGRKFAKSHFDRDILANNFYDELISLKN
ncbi:MAG: glycosyltransferase WbuB [Crocinitomicaceae bacterium]|nr:glycosyltransferase WbuB [Crocinitomicaceae bacterium]|tara:strand:- start:12372 stop:13604 length:1233 start_codon:yes stop_codon:yes gene_type:complete